MKYYHEYLILKSKPKTICNLLLLFIFVLSSCSSDKSKGYSKLKIAYSKNNAKKNYSLWLNQLCPEAELIELYNVSLDSVEILLAGCDGVLITGGNDVSPDRYGKTNEVEKCEDFDIRRDSLEFLMIQFAIRKQIPLLGICRGEQILNVVNGGTLYTDIPTDIGNKVVHRITDSVAYHMVKIKEGTLLHKICGVNEGEVNSIHHQAADKIASGYQASAFADDGVIEAIEPVNAKSFILGVQWHPERLDSTSKLSTPIGRYFIEKVRERGLVN